MSSFARGIDAVDRRSGIGNCALLFVTLAMLTSCNHAPAQQRSAGAGAAVQVDAKSRFTPVTTVQAGKRYAIRATGEWRDWMVRTTAKGFQSKPGMQVFERRRRMPSAYWFALVGVIAPANASKEELKRLTRSGAIDLSTLSDGDLPWTSPRDGVLYVFANDVNWAYFNNHGHLQVEASAFPETPAGAHAQ